MKRYLPLIILTVFLLAAIPLTFYLVQNRQIFFNKAAPTASLTLSPASGSHSVGDVFPVQIMLDTGGNDAAGAQVSISFDPAVLQVVDTSGQPAAKIISGTLFSNPLELMNIVDNTKGLISYSVSNQLGTSSYTGFKGQGVLATISFKAKSAATTTQVSFNPAPDTLVSAVRGESIAGTITGATYTVSGSTSSGLTCSGVTVGTGGTTIANAGDSRSLTANSTGGSGTVTYTWAVNTSGTNQGTLSPTSGQTVTWTAPSSLSGINSQTWTITATATDAAGAHDSTNCVVSLAYTSGTATVHHYSCSGGSCVQNDSGGTYTDPACNNSCGTSTTTTPKYRCSGTSCIRDDTNGIYTDSGCNSACSSSTTTTTTSTSSATPVTGVFEDTMVMGVSGLVILGLGILLAL